MRPDVLLKIINGFFNGMVNAKSQTGTIKIGLIAILFLFPYGISSCKKNNSPELKIYMGTVIGFDPCTGDYTDNSKKGYVIKIDSISERGDTLVVDTVVTYNLPNIFQFSQDLFVDYQTSFLFPEEFQNTFKFKFSFKNIPQDQNKAILCTTDIYTGGLYAASKGQEITILKIYK